jgi:hypothetical protein
MGEIPPSGGVTIDNKLIQKNPDGELTVNQSELKFFRVLEDGQNFGSSTTSDSWVTFKQVNVPADTVKEEVKIRAYFAGEDEADANNLQGGLAGRINYPGGFKTASYSSYNPTSGGSWPSVMVETVYQPSSSEKSNGFTINLEAKEKDAGYEGSMYALNYMVMYR